MKVNTATFSFEGQPGLIEFIDEDAYVSWANMGALWSALDKSAPLPQYLAKLFPSLSN